MKLTVLILILCAAVCEQAWTTISPLAGGVCVICAALTGIVCLQKWALDLIAGAVDDDGPVV